jgi:hypothetical protein
MMRASSFAILAATVFASPVAAQSLHVGLDSAADFTPIYETDELPGYIKEFVVSVDYAPAPPKSIHAKVIAVDVGNAAPPNTVVNEVEHPLQTGESRSSLRWSLPREFPLGIYRVDVEADGKPWLSKTFKVVAAVQRPVVSKPAEMMPLAEGTSWTFDFVAPQKPSPGVTASFPEIKGPDKDGMLRGTVVRKVGKADGAGAHLSMARNGAPIGDTWMLSNDQGQFITKREVEGQLLAFDPPQKIIPWPVSEPEQQWNWQQKGTALTQTFHLWGPVLVKGPNGMEPGYVIAQKQGMGDVVVTVEYHVIPRMGIVSEKLIQANSGQTLIMNESTAVKFTLGTGDAAPASRKE